MNIKNMFLWLFTVLVIQLQGQSSMTLKVYGNCGMCQDRIENIAKDVIGVNTATWDDSEQLLTITYQESLFTEMDLHQELVAVGHDTDKMKATDEVYENLHGCCKYDRPDSTTGGIADNVEEDIGNTVYNAAGDGLTMKVYGICGMCKDRIEKTAKNVLGVTSALWNEESQMVTITFQEGLFTEMDLHQELTAVGHDTDKMKATDEVYENMHGCCKYDRPQYTSSKSDEGADQAESDRDNGNLVVSKGQTIHGDHVHEANEVAGMIYEKTAEGDLQPLVAANIYWANTIEGTTTDIDGHFVMLKNNESSKLVVSYIGYVSDTIDMSGQSLVAITLLSNHILDEVNISYEKRATEVSFINPIKTQTITQKELCKAACCSLSESFETSPAIDVSFTDAVTGTRKIEMLGLAGPYVQIMRENMPYIRGLSAVSGLSYTPGPWIESMQLNLGTGSVVNGPESMTGQINVEIKKPETSEKLYVNLFANRAGRLEANANTYFNVNDKWSTALLAHGSTMDNSIDRNDDGFYDTPLRDQLLLMNRWKYVGSNGVRLQFGGKYSTVGSTAGQLPMASQQKLWQAQSDNNKIELWTKLGKVWEGDPFKSVGWQTSFVLHDLTSSYGDKAYDAQQTSLYSNLIFMNAINGNPKHKYKTGLSIQYDDITEDIFVQENSYEREEVMPGAFVEYTYLPSDKWSLVLGLRGDYHNSYGAFVTPRLHLRYAPQDKLAIRLAAGRGQRTASIFAENLGLFATNRTILIDNMDNGNPYGLNAEVAWNTGLNVTKEFDIAGMTTVLGFDYYYTWFDQQVVVDWDQSPNILSFSTLQGNSDAHSIQVQADIEIAEGLEFRTAYRYNEVNTLYALGSMQKPLTSRHRAFANLAWEIGKGWSWDGTYNWQGSKRIPITSSNPTEFQRPVNSPSFTMFNTQMTKTFGKALDIYLGAENLFDTRQEDPIIGAANPYGQFFDGSLVWGPVFGRNIYIGLRWKM